MFDGQIVKVIIPALNEAKAVGRVVETVPQWVDETIVVDNGSTDGTVGVAAAAGASIVREPWRGYGRACLAGLAAIGFCDVVVFLDADFSDRPEQIPRLVGPIAAGRADMVIGSRVFGGAEAGSLGRLQRFGNALSCGLIRLLWRRRHTDPGPFRAIRWSALRGLKMRDPTCGWKIEMQIKAARAHLRVLEVPVSHRKRSGVSRISGTRRGAAAAGARILATVARCALSDPPRPARPNRLIVFSRYPLPGRAKTRLIPALGPAGAAELQRRMTERTMQTALAARQQWNDTCRGPQADTDRMEVEVCYAGGTERRMRRWLGRGFRLVEQGEGDLGARMRRAVERALDDVCERAVLIGTDCMELTSGDISAAFESLHEADGVFGPTADGGCWLIGLRRNADVFDGVEWGTSAVLQQSLAKAADAGLSVRTLRALADVDTPDDLPHLPWRLPERPYLSVVIPALNEAASIEAAVASARGEDVDVLVVDGGSRDGTADLAARAGARVLTCPPGRAVQQNFGARAAMADVLLLLHADRTLPAGYVHHVFDALADPRCVGGAFEHRTDEPGVVMEILRRLVRFRARRLHMPCGDQALFVRRGVFNELGGLPELPIAGELHFVRRLRRRGRLTILPAPAVTSARRRRQVGPL